jgi:hypothetical protein
MRNLSFKGNPDEVCTKDRKESSWNFVQSKCIVGDTWMKISWRSICRESFHRKWDEDEWRRNSSRSTWAFNGSGLVESLKG